MRETGEVARAGRGGGAGRAGSAADAGRGGDAGDTGPAGGTGLIGGTGPAGGAGALPRHVRVFLRLSRRHLPAPRGGVVVGRGLTVPAGDGVTLVTDHYVPLADGPAPTLLVRSPYGRGFPWDYIYGALFA